MNYEYDIPYRSLSVAVIDVYCNNHPQILSICIYFISILCIILCYCVKCCTARTTSPNDRPCKTLPNITVYLRNCYVL